MNTRTSAPISPVETYLIYEQCRLIIMELHIAEILVLPQCFFGVEFPLFVIPCNRELQCTIPTRYALWHVTLLPTHPGYIANLNLSSYSEENLSCFEEPRL